MISDLLEPALEKRAWEVVQICEDTNKEVFKNFELIIKRLRKYAPIELMNDINAVEDLFIQKHTSMVLQAHKIGFDDCSALNRELRNLI